MYILTREEIAPFRSVLREPRRDVWVGVPALSVSWAMPSACPATRQRFFIHTLVNPSASLGLRMGSLRVPRCFRRRSAQLRAPTPSASPSPLHFVPSSSFRGSAAFCFVLLAECFKEIAAAEALCRALPSPSAPRPSPRPPVCFTRRRASQGVHARKARVSQRNPRPSVHPRCSLSACRRSPIWAWAAAIGGPANMAAASASLRSPDN
ncbi:hypothetical protein U9M48_002108 [Paspalum notatum var. saurae]|uniref:Uncharacterized protein n=1 Tax=Paspalum notatum var. saurae TaxID=547442 RepID=A0AAQ3PPS6_PASNO